jgi:hypothetical protein
MRERVSFSLGEDLDYRERPTIIATTAPNKALNATLGLTGLPELRWELPLLLTIVVVPFAICVPANPMAPVIELRLANPTLAGSARKTV